MLMDDSSTHSNSALNSGTSDMFTTSLSNSQAHLRATDCTADTYDTAYPDDYADGKEFKVYRYRFYVLAMFAALEMSNALMWVTYAPISDVSANYFGGSGSGYYGSTTAVNMMANVFLILYGPGTLLAVYMMKTLKLKRSLEIAGLLTVLGALMRYLAALFDSSLSHATVYWIMFCGQCLGALAQPMFLNSPPMVASIWFPVKERDLATTVGSMCSPIGNAIGQLIPVFLVSQSSKSHDDDDSFTVHGMADLMLVELILCVIPLLIGAVYLKDEPLTAPSQSTKLKNESRSGKLALAGVSGDNNNGNSSNSSNKEALQAFLDEAWILMRNRDYLLLFIAFSIGVGFFNSLLTLLNQIIAPFGYSNDDAGTFAAVFILFGLFGAGIMGFLMEKTRAYRTILKVGIFICVLVNILFVCMLFSNNFWPLAATFALLGFFILPLLPVMMENCAECTYPIGEEVSMGIMFVGSNVLGLGFVFALQLLLEEPAFGPPPLLPSNCFILGTIFLGFVILLFYKGEYKRLENESLRDRLLPGGATSAAGAGTSHQQSPFGRHNSGSFGSNDCDIERRREQQQRLFKTQGSGRKDIFGKSFGSISCPVTRDNDHVSSNSNNNSDSYNKIAGTPDGVKAPLLATNNGSNSSGDRGRLHRSQGATASTPVAAAGSSGRSDSSEDDGRIVRVTSTDSSNNTTSTAQGGDDARFAAEDSTHSFNFWARTTSQQTRPSVESSQGGSSSVAGGQYGKSNVPSAVG